MTSVGLTAGPGTEEAHYLIIFEYIVLTYKRYNRTFTIDSGPTLNIDMNNWFIHLQRKPSNVKNPSFVCNSRTIFKIEELHHKPS